MTGRFDWKDVNKVASVCYEPFYQSRLSAGAYILFFPHAKALGVNILVCSSLLVLLVTQGVNGYE